MTQYYIIEIQQYANGEYGHLVHYAYDEDPDKARLKAESTYHSILSSAAVSETKKHSAIILSDECFPVENKCYKHNVSVPEPEETPEEADEEPDEEPEEEEVEEPESEEESGGEGE